MKEIVKINLENEMDIILAHKRSMKLGELCGLSVISQTTFATAVSEIARCVIDNENMSVLSLGVSTTRGSRKELQACILTDTDVAKDSPEAVKYAKRLADGFEISGSERQKKISIKQALTFSGLLNDARTQSFVDYFKRELPLSPYDELRKKNIQLIDLADRLRESEAQYKKLTDTLPLMMFTTNAGGFLIYANTWLKNFFGLGEIEPNRISWLNFIHVQSNKNVREEWETAQLDQKTLSMEAKINVKNSTLESIWHLITLVPIKSDAGVLTGWTGFFVDINAQKIVQETLKNNIDLKAAQKQLLNSQSRLEEKVQELNKSNHDLEQFAYIASHDLQEPLRKIRSFTELLEAHIDHPEKRKGYMQKIDQASQRMTNLIKDVLDYSRLSRSESVFENVDLNDVLKQVMEDVELVVRDKNATIKAQKLPVINGIRPQLHQLFYNFINNALKFNNGDPVINVNARELDQEEVKSNPELSLHSKYIEITFKDNGIGFDQKYARQIFTIFKRLNSKDSFAGTGIGLALCKKIVDNHHGSIEANGEPGQGAEFIVTLPID
jgi:PAS domain S-box-containing protein